MFWFLPGARTPAASGTADSGVGAKLSFVRMRSPSMPLHFVSLRSESTSCGAVKNTCPLGRVFLSTLGNRPLVPSLSKEGVSRDFRCLPMGRHAYAPLLAPTPSRGQNFNNPPHLPCPGESLC